MQLVLSNNRIIAHGENFLSMGGVVINTATGARYENATIAECNGCPSDIDKVGYEYHAGVFVPCAPFGMGNNNGYIMEVCTDCATPRNSGIPIKNAKWETIAVQTLSGILDGVDSQAGRTFSLGIGGSILQNYSMYRIVIKAGSTYTVTNMDLYGSVYIKLYEGSTETENCFISYPSKTNFVYSTPKDVVLSTGFIEIKKIFQYSEETFNFANGAITPTDLKLLAENVRVEFNFQIEVQVRG